MTGQVMGDGDLILGRDTNARFATTSTVSTMFTERSIQSVPVFILRDEASHLSQGQECLEIYEYPLSLKRRGNCLLYLTYFTYVC